MRAGASGLVVALIATVGCADFELGAGKGSDAPEADTGVADGGGSADTGQDDGDEPGATWWMLGATIQVTDGAPVPEESRLLFTSLDADGQVRCTAEAPLEALTSVSPPEDELITWWRPAIGDWTGDCLNLDGVVPVGEDLAFGVGQMHPEILAVLDTVDTAADGSGATLNGAYARLRSGGPVYVYGVAGIEAAFLAEAGPAVEAPLPDGAWSVVPVYPFALAR